MLKPHSMWKDHLVSSKYKNPKCAILSNCLLDTSDDKTEHITHAWTPADCEYVPPEDFCLLLSSFDVSGLPKESDKGLGSATDADEISNDDGAVPEMPAFPSSLVSLHVAPGHSPF